MYTVKKSSGIAKFKGNDAWKPSYKLLTIIIVIMATLYMKDLRVVFITYYNFEGATLMEKNFDNSEDKDTEKKSIYITYGFFFIEPLCYEATIQEKDFKEMLRINKTIESSCFVTGQVKGLLRNCSKPT